MHLGGCQARVALAIQIDGEIGISAKRNALRPLERWAPPGDGTSRLGPLESAWHHPSPRAGRRAAPPDAGLGAIIGGELSAERAFTMAAFFANAPRTPRID
jgi:hypothetical protein